MAKQSTQTAIHTYTLPVSSSWRLLMPPLEHCIGNGLWSECHLVKLAETAVQQLFGGSSAETRRIACRLLAGYQTKGARANPSDKPSTPKYLLDTVVEMMHSYQITKTMDGGLCEISSSKNSTVRQNPQCRKVWADAACYSGVLSRTSGLSLLKN